MESLELRSPKSLDQAFPGGSLLVYTMQSYLCSVSPVSPAGLPTAVQSLSSLARQDGTDEFTSDSQEDN